jgi:hypothetical protein
VKIAMMLTAERDREFVADLSAKRPRLRETEMVRIARRGAAQKAGLGRDIAEMCLVANAIRLGQGERAFVDPGLSQLIDPVCGSGRAIEFGWFDTGASLRGGAGFRELHIRIWVRDPFGVSNVIGVRPTGC